jgi:regulator of sirC expression with transglutaminase-like and TPR domain
MAEPDVFEGAIRIAQAEYPTLDPGQCRAAVDALAAEARPRLEGRGRGALDALNDHFFGRWGFHGNRDDYYDPRNSYVNDVLSRRTGIPISLAAVYAEIGRLLGMSVRGVAFPGHFLAKWQGARASAIVDCFSGRVLSRDDCRELLETVAPSAPPERLDDYLLTTPPGRILSRMLGNLRQIHGRAGDHDRVLRWITLDLTFNPADPEPHRDRAFLHVRREAYAAALDDLEAYLRLAPRAPDVDDLRLTAAALRRKLAEQN